jgi:hypothetical protein
MAYFIYLATLCILLKFCSLRIVNWERLGYVRGPFLDTIPEFAYFFFFVYVTSVSRCMSSDVGSQYVSPVLIDYALVE